MTEENARVDPLPKKGASTDAQSHENSRNQKEAEPKSANFQSADALIERMAELLIRQAIDKALAGDTVALRLCIERFLPPKKERQIVFALPDVEKLHDLPRATHALLRAVSSGELTPLEAAAVAKLVETHIDAIEAADIDMRLNALESFMNASKDGQGT